MTIIDKDLAYCPVPEGAKNFKLVEDAMLRYDYEIENGLWSYRHISLSPGYQYEVIGLWPGLSEEQCKDLVENESGMDDTGAFVKVPALKSFASRMEAAGAYMVNPYKETDCGCITEFDIENCPDKCWQRVNAQSRTSKSWVVMRVKGI